MSLLVMSVVIITKAQNVDFYGNVVANNTCAQLSAKDDKEVGDCMDKICDAAGIPNNFTLQPCPNIANCYAITLNEIPYIFYNTGFFSKIKSYGFTEKKLPGMQINWSALTILAHELGHHLCQHFTKNVRERYTPTQLELQADEYAGTIMYRLGATVSQAQEAMNSSEVAETASLTHPARAERLAAIAKGWNKEYNRHANKGGTAAFTAANNITNPPAVKPNTTIAYIFPGMVLIEGGTFNMGSNEGDNSEKPAHPITLGSFYISEYEVTQAQWQAIMGSSPFVYKCNNCPADHIKWYEAQDFCLRLSNITGKIYRLPTEAEWEFAARGGNKSGGYKYSGSNIMTEVGWFFDNSTPPNYIMPVGQKKSNELGLYDMSGNLWEWCSDWYDADYYKKSTSSNPQGPISGSHKVIRGGSWAKSAAHCTVTHRAGNPPDGINDVGFRVVASN